MTMIIDKPCAVKDMPEAEYHSDPCAEPALHPEPPDRQNRREQ